MGIMKNLSVTVLGIKGIHTCKVLRVMSCTELIFNKYYLFFLHDMGSGKTPLYYRDVNSQVIL